MLLAQLRYENGRGWERAGGQSTDVEGVDVPGYVSENREQEVNEEIQAAAADEEDADGRDCWVG